MDGGRFFGLLPNKPSDTIQVLNKSNIYMKQIKNLEKKYQNIKPKNISVNNLNEKVRLFTQFSKINNIPEHHFLLEEVKKILIEKIKSSLSEFISSKFVFDTIEFSELLDRLKVFEKLLNQLKLLDKQFNLSNYNYQIQDFINKILGKYEDYIEQIFRENPNSHILDQLYHQVQNYIKLYSEFFESMTNNRKRNNPIYEIIRRLKIIFDKISIKIQLLSGQGTNINRYKLSNEMIKRIKLLYNTNIYQKRINYNSILHKLHDKYRHNPREYNLKELSILADIGSKIESISRMRNANNKNILLRDLRETIERLKKSLGNYPKFQEYEERLIIPSQ
jgi:hypothetical protein